MLQTDRSEADKCLNNNNHFCPNLTVQTNGIEKRIYFLNQSARIVAFSTPSSTLIYPRQMSSNIFYQFVDIRNKIMYILYSI